MHKIIDIIKFLDYNGKLSFYTGSNTIKAFSFHRMTDITTFLDNNGKLYVYIRVNIHELYSYQEIIGDPTTLTTSGQPSDHFGPSYFTNIDTVTIQTVIAALLV